MFASPRGPDDPTLDARPVGHAPEGSGYRGQRFLLALALGLLLVALFITWPYKGAIAAALLVGYLLQRPYRALLRRVRYRSVAGGLMLILVGLVLVLPFVLIGISLAEEAQAVASNLAANGLQGQAERALAGLGVPPQQVGPLLNQAGAAAASTLQGMAVNLVFQAIDLVVALLIFFIVLYFVLADGPQLVDYWRRVTPLDPERNERLLALIGTDVRAVLLGTILVSGIQGVAAGVGWWIFGFPQPVFWGFVMTVLAILPFAGPFFVFVPAAAFAILQGNYFGGIGLLAWGIVLVGLIDDVVRPYVIGRSSGVHPAIILIGIVGGVAFFGWIGFVLGPILLALVGPVLEAWARPENDPLRSAKERKEEAQAGPGGPEQPGGAREA